ncbi:MAG TPA: hypothetical protein VGB06_02575 [Solirubrobacterales bacterium]
MKHLQKHLSFANAVACMALFVALGSSAYAVTAALPKKSVKTKHLAQGVVTTTKLRNGAVTAAKIRNGAVTAQKIAAGAVGSTQLLDGGVRSGDLGGGVVTTGKLKDGAVTSDKLGTSAVTAAKLGADAVTTGKIADGAVTAGKLAPTFSAQLVKDISYVTATSASDSESAKTAKAECPAGKQVVGGGAKIVADTFESIAVTESAPIANAETKRTAWSATARELGAEATEWAVEAYAICATF